jgi:hypothetical protein
MLKPCAGAIIVRLKRTPRRAAWSHRVDLVAERYVWWRRESAAVADSYRSWSEAVGDQRAVAYAGYLAALDREERAANAYRWLIERSHAR